MYLHSLRILIRRTLPCSVGSQTRRVVLCQVCKRSVPYTSNTTTRYTSSHCAHVFHCKAISSPNCTEKNLIIVFLPSDMVFYIQEVEKIPSSAGINVPGKCAVWLLSLPTKLKKFLKRYHSIILWD